MPIYRATTKCFVDNSLRVVDEEFEYNGKPNPHMERVDGEPDVVDAAPDKSSDKKWKPKAKRSVGSNS
tara:strand:+ start:2647 stop:2850 length:204 start_codon:yes stop_codon:yes gene_type:complete